MASDSISQEAIDTLFQQYGLDPSLSKNMGFGVNERSAVGEYIHLEIFDGSWIEIATLLSQTEKGKEVVAQFWDDYGGSHYIAANGAGSSINFYFEEESDEMDQEGFDEEAYYSEYEKNKEKWFSIIPKVVKSVFG